jgi:HPt (histidine-containing phosphotransfer) domain-containing protein
VSIIDIDAIRQLVEDLSVQDVRHIVSTFELDMRRLLEALDVAGQASDLASWHRTAHRMAGASAAVAAVQLEALARGFMAATELHREAAREHCAQVRRVSQASIDALRAFLADAETEHAGHPAVLLTVPTGVVPAVRA